MGAPYIYIYIWH